MAQITTQESIDRGQQSMKSLDTFYQMPMGTIESKYSS